MGRGWRGKKIERKISPNFDNERPKLFTKKGSPKKVFWVGKVTSKNVVPQHPKDDTVEGAQIWKRKFVNVMVYG